jgi:hypothetical protein
MSEDHFPSNSAAKCARADTFTRNSPPSQRAHMKLSEDSLHNDIHMCAEYGWTPMSGTI